MPQARQSCVGVDVPRGLAGSELPSQRFGLGALGPEPFQKRPFGGPGVDGIGGIVDAALHPGQKLPGFGTGDRGLRRKVGRCGAAHQFGHRLALAAQEAKGIVVHAFARAAVGRLHGLVLVAPGPTEAGRRILRLRIGRRRTGHAAPLWLGEVNRSEH